MDISKNKQQKYIAHLHIKFAIQDFFFSVYLTKVHVIRCTILSVTINLAFTEA